MAKPRGKQDKQAETVIQNMKAGDAGAEALLQPLTERAEKNKGGRPTKQTPELLQLIGERLGAGEPLTTICKDLTEQGTPLCDDTVRNWMEGDTEVSRAIARAREDGELAIALRMRKVAQGEIAPEGAPKLSTGDVQRDKLIIDTDFKLLAKFNPKKWGDKVQLANSEGGNLPAPPQWIIAPVAPGGGTS